MIFWVLDQIPLALSSSAFGFCSSNGIMQGEGVLLQGVMLCIFRFRICRKMYLEVLQGVLLQDL